MQNTKTTQKYMDHTQIQKTTPKTARPTQNTHTKPNTSKYPKTHTIPKQTRKTHKTRKKTITNKATNRSKTGPKRVHQNTKHRNTR
jgi:hypothetical protein